jgi:8-oxo-dGTP pyrophosphatase MutT (NUDIX family)
MDLVFCYAKNMNKSRTNLRNLVEHVAPFDERERVTIKEVLAWIDADVGLFRAQAPDKHLVSYFVLVDEARRSLLLVHHKKAGLWVPTGGHVEINEGPREAALRELAEELGPRAAAVASVASMPLFVTSQLTRGAGAHIDVSLWYVVAADVRMWLDPDPREFFGHRWATFEEVLAMDLDGLDPALHRFVRKLEGRL